MRIIINYEQVGAQWLGVEYSAGRLTATCPIVTSETEVLAWAEKRAGAERYVERFGEGSLILKLRVLPHDVCVEDGIRSSVNVRVF